MAVKPLPSMRRGGSTWPWPVRCKYQASAINWSMSRTRLPCSATRGSPPMDDKSRVFKELGLSALRKKIEDAVVRAETLGALELEEARRISIEEQIREYNLWDDPAKSNEILVKLAGSAKVVDALKDLTYKAEEAKLIIELANTSVVNYGLFKQAYEASVDISISLDHYEMSKLLNGLYDTQGASLVIESQDNDTFSKIWADRLLSMYMKWAEKQGRKGRIIEKCYCESAGIKSTTIEFEFEFAYGYLQGERGVHRMISSLDGSPFHEPGVAVVDVIPLFLDMGSDLLLDNEDVIISTNSLSENGDGQIESSVCVQHIPTGLSVRSSGERNYFANKIKALNRLKAKLLVIMSEQGVSSISSIWRDAIVDPWTQDTRMYMSHPYKLV
ncbi:hypothetical protein Ancab_012706 [Ancistrocladus abbreviatus]